MRDLADNAGWNAKRQRIGQDIFGHNCAGADDASSSNMNAREYDCARTQPAVFFNRDLQLDAVRARGDLFGVSNSCNGATGGYHGPGPDMHASTAKDVREGVNAHVVFQSHSVCSPDSRIVTYAHPHAAGPKRLPKLCIPICVVPNDKFINASEY